MICNAEILPKRQHCWISFSMTYTVHICEYIEVPLSLGHDDGCYRKSKQTKRHVEADEVAVSGPALAFACIRKIM
jgi:hypothetical protein